MNRLLLCFVVALGLGACSSGPDAVTYHNTLMTTVAGQEAQMSAMNDAMNSENWAQAEKVRTEWLAVVETEIGKANAAGAYQGDDSFQQAVLKSLGDLKSVLTVDYPKLIAIRSGTEPDQAAESRALDAINNALEGLGNNVNAASAAFETKHGQ